MWRIRSLSRGVVEALIMLVIMCARERLISGVTVGSSERVVADCINEASRAIICSILRSSSALSWMESISLFASCWRALVLVMAQRGCAIAGTQNERAAIVNNRVCK